MTPQSRLVAVSVAACLAFASPFLAERLQGQAPAGQSAQAPGQGTLAPAGRGSTQDVLGGVSVPQGRAGGRGRQAGPPRTPPRNSSGRVVLMGATPSEKGVWLPTIGITAPIFSNINEVPWQPWARAIFLEREKHELEPHTRCKASGMARQFETPYGVEFLELTDEQRLYIFDIGGPHTFRTVYMDGRSHPADVIPSYYGHSVGWWEGDTLVIDTVGYNERFWMDRRGVPHTDKLHTIERFTRNDYNAIRYEYTVDDPGAYTAPWKGTFNLRWEPGTELFEYVCQQANYAGELMVGTFSEVDRTSPIVP
jgi:hypothetical protein